MKPVTLVLAATLACSMPLPANAAEAPHSEAEEIDRWRTSLNSTRFTGPLLTSTPDSLPEGHFYAQPFFYDTITQGQHYPASSGYYQYGLTDDLTVGLFPNFAFGTEGPNRKLSIGDTKFISQFQLTRFTPEHRVPAIGLLFNAALPVGKHDRLDPLEDGHGAGSFAPEIGISAQHYVLLKNGRLLRARINLLKSFPQRGRVTGRSVYGTDEDFRGHARPGSKTTLIGAVEYSLSRDWALALDLFRESTKSGSVRGREGLSGPLVKQTIPASRAVGFAPGIEYSWSDRAGILVGAWITLKGHNTSSSVTPAVALSRFW